MCMRKSVRNVHSLTLACRISSTDHWHYGLLISSQQVPFCAVNAQPLVTCKLRRTQRQARLEL